MPVLKPRHASVSSAIRLIKYHCDFLTKESKIKKGLFNKKCICSLYLWSNKLILHKHVTIYFLKMLSSLITNWMNNMGQCDNGFLKPTNFFESMSLKIHLCKKFQWKTFIILKAVSYWQLFWRVHLSKILNKKLKTFFFKFFKK